MNYNYVLSTGSLSPSVTYETPGATAGTDSISVTSFVFDASSNNAVLTYSGTFTLEEAIIKATLPVSAGNARIASVASKFRVAGGTPGASPATIAGYPFTLTAETGQKVFWSVEGVDILTGKTRLIAQGTSIVQA
jgi:hypothetical protein